MTPFRRSALVILLALFAVMLFQANQPGGVLNSRYEAVDGLVFLKTNKDFRLMHADLLLAHTTLLEQRRRFERQKRQDRWLADSTWRPDAGQLAEYNLRHDQMRTWIFSRHPYVYPDQTVLIDMPPAGQDHMFWSWCENAPDSTGLRPLPITPFPAP